MGNNKPHDFPFNLKFFVEDQFGTWTEMERAWRVVWPDMPSDVALHAWRKRKKISGDYLHLLLLLAELRNGRVLSLRPYTYNWITYEPLHGFDILMETAPDLPVKHKKNVDLRLRTARRRLGLKVSHKREAVERYKLRQKKKREARDRSEEEE